MAVQEHLQQVREDLDSALYLSLHQLDHPFREVPVQREPLGVVIIVGGPLDEVVSVQDVLLTQKDLRDFEEGVAAVELVQLGVDLVTTAVLKVDQRPLIARVPILAAALLEGEHRLGAVEVAFHEHLLNAEVVLVISLKVGNDVLKPLYSMLHVPLVVGTHGYFHRDFPSLVLRPLLGQSCPANAAG